MRSCWGWEARVSVRSSVYDFGKIKVFRADVLDSTDPAKIKALEAKMDLKSNDLHRFEKSARTLEPNIYKHYFFDRVKAKVGRKKPAIASSPSPIRAPNAAGRRSL